MTEFLVGLISGMILLLIAQCITNAYKKQEGRDEIIKDVAEKYRQLRETNQTDGLDGLIRSGVMRLESHEEIERSIELIKSFGHRDPVSTIRPQLTGRDLHHLFVVIREKKLKVWNQQDIESAISGTEKL